MARAAARTNCPTVESRRMLQRCNLLWQLLDSSLATPLLPAATVMSKPNHSLRTGWNTAYCNLCWVASTDHAGICKNVRPGCGIHVPWVHYLYLTEALVLRRLLEDRRCITELIHILVPVDRMKQKCFQITTKRVRRSQQFQLRR